MSVADLESISDIARRRGSGFWSVDTAARRLGIVPDRRVGTVRLFGPEAVEQIEREVDRVAARRLCTALVGAA